MRSTDNPRQLKKSRHKRTSKSSPKPSRRLSKGIWLSKAIILLAIWGSVCMGALVVWFGYDLPDIGRLQAVTRKPGISIVGQDGTLIATYGDIYGSTVAQKNLPPYIPQAILATEDRRFYNHFGVDIWGIMRAMWTNYRAQRIVQGGSTLTQQLAKNFLLSEKLYTPSDRSMRRKAQELMLALWLEYNFSKGQILNIYMNRVYLGAGTYGIEAAAQKYFGKRARSLTLYEAAVIAGLLKAPSVYSPTNNPKLADERAQVVLNTMVEAGFISLQERQSLKGSGRKMHQSYDESRVGRYFTDWIVESIPNYIGELDRDIMVITTYDARLQRIAEQQTKVILEKYGKERGVGQAALVAMTAEGAVKCMVGGRDYDQSQFNRAVQAVRQAGSAFKLFVYLAALEKGVPATAMLSDRPVRIGRWQPKNYHWQPRGEISFADAVAYSVNTATVRLAAQAGRKQIASAARRLGVVSPLPDDLSIALGSADVTLLQLTSSYAAVANGGTGVWPYAILEIRDRYGHVLYRRKGQGPGRVMSY
ncbi:MAG: transglycosylase domain-containing protein, partial [Alphaproteobacteria bacterium]|nr:transglycosylase domain-containing protein [Alphaproteobacteria bacterium]